MTIQVCLIPWININYKENGGKKSFSYKSKALISCIAIQRTGFSAHNEKNGDYNEYPSLSHFMDEH